MIPALMLFVGTAHAAGIGCKDLREMAAARLPDSVIIEVVSSAGVLRADAECVEQAGLSDVVLVAVRSHLVDPPAPAQPEATGDAPGVPDPRVAASPRVDSARTGALAEPNIEVFRRQFAERAERTRHTGTAFAVFGLATAGVGGVVWGIAQDAASQEITEGDLEGAKTATVLSVIGSSALLVGVSWTGAGLAIRASAWPEE